MNTFEPPPLPPQQIPPSPTLEPGEGPPPAKPKSSGALGPIGGAIALVVAFAAKFKFLLAPFAKFFPIALKTGGTMILSIGLYAVEWGWMYAVGFVFLILVHECGHLVAARMFELKAGMPVFIPFMGAFIALKEAPRNAWIEAWVGIGGPLLGTAGALVCVLIYSVTQEPLFIALAYTGFFLNLFNLAPISPLDGGRIVTALSPWLWLVGLAIVGVLVYTHMNPILFLLLLLAAPRLFMLFRAKTDEERRYFEVSGERRFAMATLYFGLIAFLVVGMELTHIRPPE
ncbi:MAG: site-2 protease family protein [Candidatus Hydrogenedentes bacterium]|nr:site-2 protease family protein [Candidatus Hydrogenedentota bacterium]